MSIEQGKLIDKLNDYLRWQNISLKLDDKGVCNGLALVHAKYVLEKKEDKFFQILHDISHIHQIENASEDLNLFLVDFISQVLLAYSPKEYYKHLSQAKGSQMLKVNGKPLESSFDFSLVAKESTWVHVLDALHLRDDEVMQVSSADHAVSVHKKNGQYILYDPNSGRKKCKNSKELLKELRGPVFGYKTENIGLQIHVLRHPDSLAQPREFPDIQSLYERCYKKRSNGKSFANINDIAVTRNGKKFKTLTAAAISNDMNVINYLIGKGASDYYTAARYAIYNDNVQAIDPLLRKIRENSMMIFNRLSHDPKKQKEFAGVNQLLKNSSAKLLAQLACEALAYGSSNACDAIIAEMQPQDIQTLKYDFVLHAAQGGNETALRKVLALMTEPKDKIIINKLAPAIMERAIDSRNLSCVHFVTEQKYSYSEEQKVKFLVKAVQQDNYVVVDALLNNLQGINISSESLKSISMSTRIIANTNPAIWKSLEEKGMEFTQHQRNVIAKNNKEPIGFLPSLGIILYKFTDYLKEVLGKKQGISYDQAFFKKEPVQKNSIDDDLPPMEPLILD